jgi:hypothetical protein
MHAENVSMKLELWEIGLVGIASMSLDSIKEFSQMLGGWLELLNGCCQAECHSDDSGGL